MLLQQIPEILAFKQPNKESEAKCECLSLELKVAFTTRKAYFNSINKIEAIAIPVSFSVLLAKRDIQRFLRPAKKSTHQYRHRYQWWTRYKNYAVWWSTSK